MKNPGVKITAYAIMVPALLISINACRSHEAPAENVAIEIKTDSVVNKELIEVDSTGDTLRSEVDTNENSLESSNSLRKPLKIMIQNLASPSAPVIVGVYGRANKFPDPNDQFKIYKLRPNGNELVAEINDLEFGTYALAIYQDVNDNGKIDRNLIGIPTEPYVFSNNFKPLVKAPTFDNCKFDYDSNTSMLTLKMIK